MSSNSKKVAIVTGGTSGIGLGTSRDLASQGFNLILGFLNDTENAAKSKEMLEKEYNVEVHTIQGDMAEPETIEAYFQCLGEKFDNQLTAIVHGAGLYAPDTHSTDPDTKFTTFKCYDYYQSIYPKCFIRLVEKGVKYMKDGEGRIVSVSSPGCNACVPVRTNYMMPGTGKATLEYLTRHYAKFLAPRQITSNCVIPGFIKTKPWKPFLEKIGDDIGEKRTPMGRWGETNEIGNVIGFLCSSKAAFLTGAIIPVDGGLHLVSS